METIEKLNKQLENATSEEEYDRITARLQEAKKQETIRKAREAAAAKAAAEAKRQALIAKREKLLKEFDELKAEFSKHDDEIFSHVQGLFDANSKRDQRLAQARQVADEINNLAHTLELNTQKVGVKDYGPLGVGDGLLAMVERYADHRRALSKRRAEGRPVPERVTRAMMKSPYTNFAADGEAVDHKGRSIE